MDDYDCSARSPEASSRQFTCSIHGGYSGLNPEHSSPIAVIPLQPLHIWLEFLVSPQDGNK